MRISLRRDGLRRLLTRINSVRHPGRAGCRTEQRLRCRPPRWKQRAQEVVILRILNAIAVHVNPPPSAEIARLPRSKFRLAVGQELEFPPSATDLTTNVS
jgi:hypothetical protein